MAEQNTGLHALTRDGFALMPARAVSQADILIERATRAHTVDGYTGHAALCRTYETIIRDLCQQLDDGGEAHSGDAV